MTARTKDGQVVFNDSNIYMLQCTGSEGGESPDDVMVYGSSKKLGYVVENTFQPLQTKVEKYEIEFPFEDVKQGEKTVRKIKSKQMDITVRLIWQNDPDIGRMGYDSYILYETTKEVSVR